MDETGTRKARRWGLGALTATAFLSCGGGLERAEVPDSIADITLKQRFTTKAELEALASKPPPEVAPHSVVVVDTWSLEGEAAGLDEDKAPPQQAMWRSAVIEAAGGDAKAALSPALHCVAEQLGRFRLKHDGAPEPRLGRFMLSRCGATYASVSDRSVAVTIRPDEKDVDVFAAMNELMKKEMAALMAKEPEDIPVRRGVWFQRDGERAIFTVVTAAEEIELSTKQKEGQITFRGRVQAEADEVAAWITHGKNSVAQCDVSGQFPQVELTCGLEDGDEQAWIDINLRRHGQFTWRRAAGLMIHRDGHRAVAFTPLPEIEGEGGPGQLLIAEANRRRSAQEAPALAEAPAQSAVQTKLAPNLIAAHLEHDDELTQRILLGGIAGWDVPGPLSDAHGLIEFSPNRTQAATWAAEILERPSGRIALLDPTMTQVAVGVSENEPTPGLAGFITTYAPFVKHDDLRPIADYAQKRLDEARMAKGRPPSRRRPLQALAMALSRIQGGASPTEAFREAADSAQFELGRPVSAGYIVVSHPSQIAFPKTALDLPSMVVDIRVVQHEFPGTNWGTYIVFYFFAEDT